MKQRICDICGKVKTGWCVDIVHITPAVSKPWVAARISFTQDICTDCLSEILKKMGETLQKMPARDIREIERS